jgi:hypothetical protein
MSSGSAIVSIRFLLTQIAPPSGFHQLEDGGLPRTARAKDHFRVTGQQLEAHLLQHDLVVEGQRDLVEHDGRVWCTHLFSAGSTNQDPAYDNT